MSERPEWFELTEGDKRSNSNKQKPSRNIFIRALAIGVPLVIVGSAMVFAEGDSEAEEIPQSAVVQSTQSTTATAAADSQSDSNSLINSDNTSGNSSNDNSGNSVNSASAPKNPTFTDPNSNKGLGVPAPSGNREDSDEHEGREHEGREGGEHREREGREGREHRERENAPKIPTTTSKN